MTASQLATHPLVTAAYGFAAGWLMQLVKHAPPPLKKDLWMGAMFDATQAQLQNTERIGQRRDTDSAFLTETKADGKTATAKTETEPKIPNDKGAL